MSPEPKKPSQPGDVSAVLLCGGDSRRLSFPKEMLRVDREPLAAKLVERLKSVCGGVSVVTNRPEYLRPYLDVPIHTDLYPGRGPLAGLHAGLEATGAERALFLACDMPLVHIDMLKGLVERSLGSDADAVVARAGGRAQPLPGVYHARLLPRLDAILAEERDLSVRSFLDGVRVEFVDFEGEEARRLRDVDTPADLHLLEEEFADVEPLPVAVAKVVRMEGGGGQLESDVVAEEWPIAVFVNGTRLATVMCLPTGVREFAYGFLRYLGLAETADDVAGVEVDYRGKRLLVDLDASTERIKSAVQLLVTSTCGANVYGGALPELTVVEEDEATIISRTHILECISGLRATAPVFERTGCTHQAAFTDGKRIRYFFEDIGRHNAIDKITGAAMLDGVSLSHGALVTTGRLNSEMAVKALRARTPVLASRSAPTTNAIKLSENYGLTLVGFARAGRLNVYTHPRRIG